MNDTASKWQSFDFSVEGMSCASCVVRLEQALAAVPGVESAKVNLITQSVSITYVDTPPIHAVVKAAKAAGYPANVVKFTVPVTGASCASCVDRIERAIKAVDGVLSAEFNLATSIAHVSALAKTSRGSISNAILEAGYTPLDDDGPDDLGQSSAQGPFSRFVLAALLTLPVFTTEMGGHLYAPFHHWLNEFISPMWLGIMQFLLTTLVLVWPGREFFSKGVPALVKGRGEMNSLVALGAGAAWTYSTLALFFPQIFPAGTAQLYFESAAVIVTLILLGRWLEARAKSSAEGALQALLKLQPDMALVERAGKATEVRASALRIGDIVHVKPGSQVVVDGVVLEGSSHVDEAMLTGEARPISKTVDDVVTGGTTNQTGFLKVQATAIGEHSTLAKIIKIVQSAQSGKLPVQEMVDKITRWFVPVVIVTAALTLGVWLLFGADQALSKGIVAAVSVLIIACPCAMGLATPTSILVGTGRAANLGILFRKGTTLQTLKDVRVVAFDKTGTLTKGQFEVAQQTHIVPDLLPKIAALQARSEHPIAVALANVLPPPSGEVSDFRAISGRGVTGQIDGADMLIGNAEHMQENGIPILDQAPSMLGATRVYAAYEGRMIAHFDLADQIRPEAVKEIANLKEMGLHVTILSGDAQSAVDNVAQELGGISGYGGLLPEEKLDQIRVLQDRFGPVAFVGDGINDAPALAAADVGLSMGAGTDVAKTTADVILLSGGVSNVSKALRVSQTAMRNIKQNLGWAFGYNVLLIPVAAGVLYPGFGVLLSPPLAAGAMALSSVLVVANALRLRGIK